MYVIVKDDSNSVGVMVVSREAGMAFVLRFETLELLKTLMQIARDHRVNRVVAVVDSPDVMAVCLRAGLNMSPATAVMEWIP
jgi:hypothetical protein